MVGILPPAQLLRAELYAASNVLPTLQNILQSLCPAPPCSTFILNREASDGRTLGFGLVCRLLPAGFAAAVAPPLAGSLSCLPLAGLLGTGWLPVLPTAGRPIRRSGATAKVPVRPKWDIPCLLAAVLQRAVDYLNTLDRLYGACCARCGHFMLCLLWSFHALPAPAAAAAAAALLLCCRALCAVVWLRRCTSSQSTVFCTPVDAPSAPIATQCCTAMRAGTRSLASAPTTYRVANAVSLLKRLHHLLFATQCWTAMRAGTRRLASRSASSAPAPTTRCSCTTC